MKFLADMGISMAMVRALREAGEDVVHLRELGLHRLGDDRIFEKAIQEERVILTCDLDFGDLVAASGSRFTSVVLFRTRNQTPSNLTPRLFQVLREMREVLESGAIVVVEDANYRVRRLPLLPA